ncbi:hypothetical protein Avbf_04540 [Armadillidium vulgare]|nr:hypothetical protein Avbf_04540 [Armadillidium vulgare]
MLFVPLVSTTSASYNFDAAISLRQSIKGTRSGDLLQSVQTRCYSDYNNPTPINILFPLSDKLSFPIHQFPILILDLG